MEKLRNLDEQIYLLTYGKPMYKLEISKVLYGSEKKQIYPEFQKLEDKGWIKKISQKEKQILIKKEQERTGKEDHRAKKRQYYKADISPLYDYFCKTLEKDNKMYALDEQEKNELKRFLNNSDFKDLIYRLVLDFISDSNNCSFNSIKEIISLHCTFCLIIRRYTYLKLKYRDEFIDSDILINREIKEKKLIDSIKKMWDDLSLPIMKDQEQKELPPWDEFDPLDMAIIEKLAHLQSSYQTGWSIGTLCSFIESIEATNYLLKNK